jgi:hypothetical protein
MTSIDLSDCEIELRKYYNISIDKKLYIKKIDAEQSGFQIPKVEYDIYSKLNDSNLIKLDKLVCSNIKINIRVPIKITENLDVLNSSSGYYNDICYTATSERGTDISLKDRKENYINDNKTVCQDDCDFSEYFYDIQNAQCSCEVRESSSSYNDIIIDKKKLYKNFIKVKNIANMKILTCYKKLFTKEAIIHNIGCFVIFPITIIHIITIIIFYSKHINEMRNIISDIRNKLKNINSLKSKKAAKSKNKTKNNIINIDNNKEKKKKISIKNNANENKKNNPPKNKRNAISKINKIIHNNNNYILNILNVNNEKNKKIIETQINERSNNVLTLKSKKQKALKESNNINKFTDEELNELSYNLALKYDKRTYCIYYFSLLRTKHNFIFSFFNNTDYNSRVIKYDLFLITFGIYYAVNAPFFNDDLLHNIYEKKGTFDFIYTLFHYMT